MDSSDVTGVWFTWEKVKKWLYIQSFKAKWQVQVDGHDGIILNKCCFEHTYTSWIIYQQNFSVVTCYSTVYCDAYTECRVSLSGLLSCSLRQPYQVGASYHISVNTGYKVKVLFLFFSFFCRNLRRLSQITLDLNKKCSELCWHIGLH